MRNLPLSPHSRRLPDFRDEAQRQHATERTTGKNRRKQAKVTETQAAG